jgi:hypothetical protein
MEELAKRGLMLVEIESQEPIDIATRRRLRGTPS